MHCVSLQHIQLYHFHSTHWDFEHLWQHVLCSFFCELNDDWCWLMLVGADWCWLILVDSQWCWLMLINYDWFWIMNGWMNGSFQFYTFELLHCSRLYNKFFFEIEAGLNDLPHGAHLCRYTTDWMINCFLKSTGKLLRCCTSETTQRTWEEIQRINQEKSSCNNFSHLLKTIIQCKH